MDINLCCRIYSSKRIPGSWYLHYLNMCMHNVNEMNSSVLCGKVEYVEREKATVFKRLRIGGYRNLVHIVGDAAGIVQWKWINELCV